VLPAEEIAPYQVSAAGGGGMMHARGHKVCEAVACTSFAR
jgi:hypothetical protein